MRQPAKGGSQYFHIVNCIMQIEFIFLPEGFAAVCM
jgi:hypothetical protein